jgi:hypothetical protein
MPLYPPAAGGAGPLLDSTHNTDTVTSTVVRGGLVVANSTPKWAQLAIGSANRVLRCDGTDAAWGQVALATDVSGVLGFAGLPVGTVLQVVTGKYSTSTATSSSAFSDTGLTAAITPKASSSKILVIVHQSGCGKDSSNTYVGLQLLRGSNVLTAFELEACYTNSTATLFAGSGGCAYLDSPATTSSTTYKTQMKSGGNAAWAYTQVNSSESTIALIEIAG